MNLRYELLPFFYNEFYNASQTGIPIVRSMFLNYQDDNECYSDNAQYQFMIGDNLLVAPVLSEYENYRKLYLPEGKWLDWESNKVYEGKQWIIVEAPIEKIPVFIREGAVIPMQSKQNYVGEKKIEELVFRIFPSAKSAYTFYQDDGQSRQYRNGEYLLTQFDIQKNPQLGIKIEAAKGDYNTGIKFYRLNIFRDTPVQGVTVNGNSLNQVPGIEELSNKDSGYYYESENNMLIVKIPRDKSISISVN